MFRAASVAIFALGATSNVAVLDDASCADGTCSLELLQVQARPKHTKEEMGPECGPHAWSLASSTVLHSNLGGAGPDAGAPTLVFGSVKPGINLVVSASSDYVPNVINADGGVMHNRIIENAIGSINVATGSAATFTFEFQDTAGTPVSMPRFAFSVFDTDQGAAHESRESVTIGGLSSHRVSADTDLTVAQEAAQVTSFVSTLRGGKVDNPLSPTALTTLQERRTFVAYFDAGTTSFTVTVKEENYASPQGRNILFAGPSGLSCGEDASCEDLVCPAGYSRRTDAEFLECGSNPCSASDVPTCCYQASGGYGNYGPGSYGGWR